MIKLLQRLKQRVEGIGLMFILLAFMGQTIQTTYTDESTEWNFLFISENMNRMWHLMCDDYKRQYFSGEGGKPLTLKEEWALRKEFEQRQNDYKYYQFKKEQIKGWEEGAEWWHKTWILLFIIGNLLLIYDKVKPLPLR
jgi:hypothetical protein